MPTLAETNKNPLNLRPLPGGEKWQGQTGISTNPVTGKFCVFKDNEHGVRAAVINMRSYVKFSGVKTLKDVIYRWAPPPPGGEIIGQAGSAVGGVDMNHTAAYLQSVCRQTGLPADFDVTALVSSNSSPYFKGKIVSIVRAMNVVEAGKSTITLLEAQAGVNMALGVPEGYTRQDDGNIIREDMKQSETLKINTQGQVANVAATGTAAVTAFSAISDWRIAAIVAGVILIAGAATAIYFWRLRKDRKMMHENGIA
jgi:hypothetical protein